MDKHEKKFYRAGYNNGKSKAKIIRTTLVQRIPMNDEKYWKNTINLFAWMGILVTLALGVTLIIMFDQQETIQEQQYWLEHNEKVYDVQMNYTDAVYRECIRQLESHPIITEIEYCIN